MAISQRAGAKLREYYHRIFEPHDSSAADTNHDLSDGTFTSRHTSYISFLQIAYRNSRNKSFVSAMSPDIFQIY
jgi:hypothetical protein